MDELRLFVSLKALCEGRGEPDALRAVLGEIERLEKELAQTGAVVEPPATDREIMDNLYLLRVRQSLEPEGKVRRWPPFRWLYGLGRRLLLGTQRRYNESVTLLIRRLYAMSVLSRYYQLRSLALERRIEQIAARLEEIERRNASSESPSEPESSR